MKKSALLAVSALSLGVVGLATFSPIVNAAAQDTVNVTLEVLGGIGVKPGTAENGLFQDVDLGTLDANAMTKNDVRSKVGAYNNNGNGFTITMKSTDAEAALKNGSKKIVSNADVKAGNAAWAVKVNGAKNYAAVPASGAAAGLKVVDQAADAQTGVADGEYNVDYAASTATNTAAGTYTGTVEYTVAEYTPAESGK